MCDWIDELFEADQLKSYEREMGMEEANAAQTAAHSLMPAVLERAQKDAAYFRGKFPRRSFKGPVRQDDGTWYLMSERFPLHKLTYFVDGVAIQFERERTLSPDASEETQEIGTIYLRADLANNWFEHKGEKLMLPKDVSHVLLGFFSKR